MTRIMRLLLLASVAYGRLFVYGPEPFNKIFQNQEGEIPTQYANFGHVPYGQTLVAKLVYNEQDPTGCHKMNHAAEGEEKEDMNERVIYLLEHAQANCSFVQQTRNVEKHGGSMALIIDAYEKEDIMKVTLSDDGTGAGIRIPAMLISKTDGQKIIDYLKNAKKGESENTMMKAVFETEFFKDNIVNVDFWYTTSDDNSLDFVHGVSHYVEKLTGVINWEPRFVTWACPMCPDDYKEANCVSDGKYCAMRKNSNLRISGAELLHEDLRQFCLHSLTKDHESSGIFFGAKELAMSKLINSKALAPQAIYFEYLKRAHELYETRISEEESEKLMDNFGIDFGKIQECVNETFEGPNHQLENNNVFEQNAKDWQKLGTHLYPSMTINGQTFRGRLTPNNVFEAICASFKREPRQCHRFQRKHHIPLPNIQSRSLTNRAVFMIIMGLFIVNLIIIFAYRKYLNKELDKDIQVQVSSAVSQYVALSQVPELQQPGQASVESIVTKQSDTTQGEQD